MKTALICFYLLGMGYTFGQDTSTHVKEVREYKVSIIDNDTSLKINSIIKYDSAGNILEDIYFDNLINTLVNNTFKSKTLYTYDQMNKVKSVSYFSDGNENPNRKTIFFHIYDSEGLIIRDSLRSTDSSGTIIFYEYDQYKNITKKTYRPFTDYWYVEPEDILDKNIKYVYDKNSHVTTIDYTGLGLNQKEHFTYDSIGNCISYNYEGRFSCGVGAVYNYNCKYDESSNLIEKAYNVLEFPESVTKYYYSGNLLIKEIHFSEKLNYTSICIYEYEFY